MAELNFSMHSDPTLEAMDDIVFEENNKEKKRNYLGASSIGHPCWRKLFYYFRKVEKKEISRKKDIDKFNKEIYRIKSVNDGRYQELLTIENMRKVPGVKIYNDDGTIDKDGNKNQIGFKMLLGHFNGHIDGVITGLKQAPKTPHIFEVKCKAEKYFNDLEKLKSEKGEKSALQFWSEEYFAQAQVYMYAFNLERHYLVCCLPGGRKHISVRTEYNKKIAEDIIEKARVIIFDNWNLPARLSEKREFYKCNWCEYQEICHDGKFSLGNCRTCRYSEPMKDGQFVCHFKEKNLIDFKPCNNHIYNPALVSAKLIEQQADCCTYDYNGVKFANCSLSGIPELKGELDFIYTSGQLRDEIQYITNIKLNLQKKKSRK